jgi:arylsulfatase A-like enzyme
LACTGSGFYETPNIDRLAGQGLRFTSAYSACTVCSPTRASLLTGKYPARLHITDWIPGHPRPFAKLAVPKFLHELPLAEVTLAEALKPAGYASAAIGKWHLGGKGFLPTDQGFDLNAGGEHRGQPPSYFSPYGIGTLPDGPKGEYLTDRLTAEAERFVEANKDRPFFLYLAHYAVHTPLQAGKDVVGKYREKAKANPDQLQRNAVYAAMIASLDDGVGRLMRKLDDLGLADDTLVVFTSDNGGLLPVTSNLPLRAGKGSAYEGGVRVPMIVRWPGVVKPGTVTDVPAISPDLFPTILEAARVASPADTPVDGVSLMPLLKGTGRPKRDALYWHYPHYHPGGASPYSAVRCGDEKLVEFLEDGRVELYDLKADPGEKEDLAAARPARAAELRKMLADWRTQVGAQMPTPNPGHDPAKDRKPVPKPKEPEM